MDILSSLFGLIPLNSTDVNSSVNVDTNELYYLQVYPIFLIGLPLNLIVIYLSFVDKNIKGNYRYLLGNLALCDIFFLCSTLLSNLMYVYLLENEMLFTPFWCSL